MPREINGVMNQAVEWSCTTGKPYKDPFNEIEVDAMIDDQAGRTWKVPAFWAGDLEWRIRFAAPHSGTFRYRAVCSDESNRDFDECTGTLHVTEYSGGNRLLRHGPLRRGARSRYLEHADGVPFFWLGDTWWLTLCSRLQWPDEYQWLVADRRAKGFTVVQFVAGLFPDMPAFDARGDNEAGQSWEPDFARIRPAYYDMADLRIQHLVRSEIVPCVFGCWAYYLPWLGIGKMRQHWRNLVARYGAYPVVWCLAGECGMPYYLSADRDRDAAQQRAGWTAMGQYVREIDPYGHPITIHPKGMSSATSQLADRTVVDLNMLQESHNGYGGLRSYIEHLRKSAQETKDMPVINGEVCYEGIMGINAADIQRVLFWTSMLGGAAGFTYGANGIWQVNARDDVYGPSPHGMSWGDTLWTDASRLPGSTHMGVGRQVLERYPWWRFEPHQDWIETSRGTEDLLEPCCAGIPGKLRLYYLPAPNFPYPRSPLKTAVALEPGVSYRAAFVSPLDGREVEIGPVSGDQDGRWQIPCPPVRHDWVVVLDSDRGSEARNVKRESR